MHEILYVYKTAYNTIIVDELMVNTANISNVNKLNIGIYICFIYRCVSGPECRPKSGNKNRKQIIWKCVTVQVFGNDSNKSKFDIGGN
jgi:hypothetical protein